MRQVGFSQTDLNNTDWERFNQILGATMLTQCIRPNRGLLKFREIALKTQISSVELDCAVQPSSYRAPISPEVVSKGPACEVPLGERQVMR